MAAGCSSHVLKRKAVGSVRYCKTHAGTTWQDNAYHRLYTYFTVLNVLRFTPLSSSLYRLGDDRTGRIGAKTDSPPDNGGEPPPSTRANYLPQDSSERCWWNSCCGKPRRRVVAVLVAARAPCACRRDGRESGRRVCGGLSAPGGHRGWKTRGGRPQLQYRGTGNLQVQ